MLGKMDFADGIKSEVLRRREGLELSGWALSTIVRILMRRRQEAESQRGRCDHEVEIRVLRAASQKMQSLAAGKGKDRILSWILQKECSHADPF